jgi:hypothetical protein
VVGCSGTEPREAVTELLLATASEWRSQWLVAAAMGTAGLTVPVGCPVICRTTEKNDGRQSGLGSRLLLGPILV